MKRKTRLEELAKLVRVLENRVVLVEGKRDVKALEEIGVKARFVTANGSSESLLKRVSEVLASPQEKVFLLMDFDAEGKRKESFFKTLFEENGISTDSVFARKLRGVLRFNNVEESGSRFLQLKEKGELNGKNVH
ncbi:MAG TPA: toprim domain-containing protein [Candidatus Norongarragalinales archaeon]|nr:toprim domain-containing protein [Candidatus Norongarragalinales archaeon]